LNQTTSLTPEVLDEVKQAWSSYFEKFNKKISTPPPAAPNGQASDSVATSSSALQSTSALTWEDLQAKIATDAQWVQTVKVNHEKFGMQLDTLMAGRKAIDKAEKDLSSGKTDRAAAADLLNGSKDIVSEQLDKQKGDTVTDPAIFRSLAAYWEKSFFDDMDRLHVESPVTLTRVSEYVPEITTFVEKIIENGYAYEGEDGSVYFDTRRFDGAKGKEAGDWCHSYAKLQPWSKGNKELLEDGEGSLSVAGRTKKSPSDFALWKASKPGEPAWPSKWGMGRPGWHIECSVMASDVLGKTMDIHPHHDNEIAQSEVRREE
jgi:cysteinyl-tRNA synthetase